MIYKVIFAKNTKLKTITKQHIYSAFMSEQTSEKVEHKFENANFQTHMKVRYIIFR